MRARDLMRREVFTVAEDDPIEEVLDALVGEHIHGAPVVDDEGRLLGVISQHDIYFGWMTRQRAGKRKARGLAALSVRDLMTSPAVAAGEETELVDLCRLMHRLRIHRVPIVREGRLTGILSSLDICAAVADGKGLRD